MAHRLSFDVLRALADGEFHSGAALAASVDVTRATICNAVHGLEGLGLAVYSVRGRGYRLAMPVSMLDRELVLRHAGAEADRFELEIHDALDSTSTQLMQRATAGAPSGTVIAAELQSGGRGRMGRAWHSEIGGALTFSLLWRFREGAGALAGLSLAVGVALVRALTRLGASGVQMKWPNDIVANDAKLAGILVEMQGDALGPSAAVIGIGVNVRLSAQARAQIDQPATDLASLSRGPVDRSAVLGVTLAELARMLDAFARSGFAPLKAEWERSHALHGQSVELKLAGGTLERGFARGVADDGALLFETAGGIRRVHSGEVSLRRARSRAGVSRQDAAGRDA